MSEIVEVLNEIVERHDCSHPAIVSKASAEITRLTAEVERRDAALRECEAELNAYYRMEYPSDHPYSQKKLAQAMASNPATVALKENNNDQG
jgi:hypothetical protein